MKRINQLSGKIVKRVANKNYYTARALYHYKLGQKEKQFAKTPIFVYSMGKVGSLTVTETLRNLNLNRNIYHFHILQPDRVAVYEKFRKRLFPDIDGAGLRYVWLCQYIYKWVQRASNVNRWKIITLIRDPVARAISDFFENSQFVNESTVYTGKYRVSSDWYGYDITINKADMNELIQAFVEKYDHERPLVYFDLEFKDVLGINLYDFKFPTTGGFDIIKCKNTEILILKLEHLDNCAASAFRKFLAIDNFVMSRENIGKNKNYAKLYKQFKNQIQFPDEFLDRIYNSKMVRHFYSKKEITEFKERWTK